MKTLLLCGGGIDSSTALSHLISQGHEVSAIFFNYGQKACRLEAEACRRLCTKYQVSLTEYSFDFSNLGNSAILSNSEKSSTVAENNLLAGRNLVFLSLAASYAAPKGIESLAVGFHVEPIGAPFPDASRDFFLAAKHVLSTAFHPKLELIAPFLDMTRKEIYALALKLDPSILEQAHTCYEDVVGGCGLCTHCRTRQLILGELNVRVSS